MENSHEERRRREEEEGTKGKGEGRQSMISRPRWMQLESFVAVDNLGSIGAGSNLLGKCWFQRRDVDWSRLRVEKDEE